PPRAAVARFGPPLRPSRNPPAAAAKQLRTIASEYTNGRHITSVSVALTWLLERVASLSTRVSCEFCPRVPFEASPRRDDHVFRPASPPPPNARILCGG